MRQISGELKKLMQEELGEFVICLSFELQNGQKMGFTSSQEGFELEGLQFSASSGLSLSAIHADCALSADNFEFESAIDDELISESEILAGKFDHAQINLFLLNVQSQDKMHLASGVINEINMENGSFFAEVTGIARKLENAVTKVFSKNCTATFCDEKCKMNLANFSSKAKISNVFEDGSLAIFDHVNLGKLANFTDGHVEFLDGELRGQKFAVKKQFNDRIFLKTLPNSKPKLGSEILAVQGCDKQFATCLERFNNIRNFRGFPHLPGFDEVMKTAGTR